MTIEKMTMLSYALLAVAVVLGITALVLFFTLRIPKAYRMVKGQKKSKKIQKSKTEAVREKAERQEAQTELLSEDKMSFRILQDITYIHISEK